MNPIRAKAYTLIRERYVELTKTMSCAEAVRAVAEDPTVNILGYSVSYIRDVAARIDPVRKYRRRRG